MKKTFFKSCLLVVALGAITLSCSKDKDKDNEDVTIDAAKAQEAWGKVMAGNDTTEYTWPDLSENYWFYPMDVEGNANVGLRIKGQFPKENTRFFNVTVYNDQTMQRVCSIEDFNLAPNSDSKNPFVATSTGSDYFEINIVPQGTDTSKLKNPLVFPTGMKKLSLLLRIYFNTLDHKQDFGGVELPQLVFFDLSTGKDIKPAERTTSNYYSYFAMVAKSIPVLKSQPAMVFTLAPSIAYSNGPTGYVSAANRIKTGDALFFRFIPPVSPTVGDFASCRTADVRYWSVCVGDTATYTPHTITDRMVMMDGEYVNFMIVTKNDPMLATIKATVESKKINLIVWDIDKHGAPLMVFYRQMYINKSFAYSVQTITAYPPLNPQTGMPDPTVPPTDANLAHKVLGQHGPFGIVAPSGMILSPTFNTASLRGGQ